MHIHHWLNDERLDPRPCTDTIGSMMKGLTQCQAQTPLVDMTCHEKHRIPGIHRLAPNQSFKQKCSLLTAARHGLGQPKKASTMQPLTDDGMGMAGRAKDDLAELRDHEPMLHHNQRHHRCEAARCPTQLPKQIGMFSPECMWWQQ